MVTVHGQNHLNSYTPRRITMKDFISCICIAHSQQMIAFILVRNQMSFEITSGQSVKMLFMQYLKRVTINNLIGSVWVGHITQVICVVFGGCQIIM